MNDIVLRDKPASDAVRDVEEACLINDRMNLCTGAGRLRGYRIHRKSFLAGQRFHGEHRRMRKTRSSIWPSDLTLAGDRHIRELHVSELAP